VRTSAPRLFDREAIARARARAERMDHEPFLVCAAAEGIAERIESAMRSDGRALDLDSFPQSAAILNRFGDIWSRAHLDENETVCCDESGFALATSVLGLHFVNDVPGVLMQLRRMLSPEGLFVGAMIGGESLRELRSAIAAAELEILGGTSPHVAPSVDVRDAGNLMQRAGFLRTVSDVERTTVLYKGFDDLIYDLRANALSNTLIARNRRPLSRRVRESAIAHYRRTHTESDGRLRATFDIIYCVGHAPSP